MRVFWTFSAGLMDFLCGSTGHLVRVAGHFMRVTGHLVRFQFFSRKELWKSLWKTHLFRCIISCF